MILFFENGGLGNQLFQYYGLKNYFSNHKLIFFGFKTLKIIFTNLDVQFVNIKNTWSYHLLKKTLFFLASIRFVGTINETFFYHNIPSSGFKIIIRRGLLWNILLANHIFFQDKICVEKINNKFFLKKKIINRAMRWFKKKKIDLNKYNLVFVHIRRGDYLSWPHPKYSASLDLSWYIKSIFYLKTKIKKPIFILMGDDLSFIKRYFKKSKLLIISENSPEIDLAIMSKCSHGIMSPSTFAWWGSYISNLNKINKKKSYFIAPKFWAGHRLKKWLPYKNFIFNWITYKSTS